MSDSNKKFPKGADFYYQRRHLYYKDWYWYLPESVKYLIIALSATTFPFFIYLIDSVFHDGEYLVTLFLIGIWLWSGIAGAKNAWWMPDRVTDELKYTYGYQSDFWETELAAQKGINVLFVIISSPINFIYWSIAAFFFLGPILLGAVAFDHLFSVHDDFQYLGLIISSWPYLFGSNAIYVKHKAFQVAAMNNINDIRKAGKLRKNDVFKNLEFDVAQLCNKKFTFEYWVYCMTFILVELLILNS